MAVDLVFQVGDGPCDSVPVATTDFFKKFWEKGARQCHLPLVPTLRHGVSLDAEGAAALLLELAALQKWAAPKAGSDYEYFRARVERLAADIRRLLDMGVKDFSFG